VEKDVWESLEVGLDGFDAAGVEIWFGAVAVGIVFARDGKAGECVEKVQGNVSLALTNHAGGTAFEDTNFRDGSRLFALHAGERVEEKSLVARE